MINIITVIILYISIFCYRALSSNE